MVRDPIVGGTAALTVLATWSLWGEVVKGGDNYILTEPARSSGYMSQESKACG
jgi:hypothetical protein